MAAASFATVDSASLPFFFGWVDSSLGFRLRLLLRATVETGFEDKTSSSSAAVPFTNSVGPEI